MSTNKVCFDDRVKPKNVLALNEKVAAIRRYEADPVYKSVGRYFNCSPDQIKRIIKQKDEILLEWNNRTRKSVVPTSHEVKTVKMSFLGKAVHEWIRRMMYYTDFNLTNALIQTMAIEFKKVLGLQNFFPDKMWIVNFRNTYSLKDVNTKTLNIGYQESHSVQIRDILRDLQSTCGSDGSSTNDIDIPQSSIRTIVNGFDLKDEVKPPIYKFEITQNVPSCSNSTVAFDKLSVKPAIKLPVKSPVEITNPIIILPPVTVKSELEEEEAIRTEEQQKWSINTQEDAMNCVRQLEEFALLKENFRLIGLIERLEEALKEKC